MINNEKSLVYFLEDLSRLKEISTADLEAWIARRPYCQNLRMLKAKKAFDPAQTGQEDIVEEASFYSIDRPRLYHFLHDLSLVKYVKEEEATHELEPKLKPSKADKTDSTAKAIKKAPAAAIALGAAAAKVTKTKVEKAKSAAVEKKEAKVEKQVAPEKATKVDQPDAEDEVIIEVLEATPKKAVVDKQALITAPPPLKLKKEKLSLTEALERNVDINLSPQEEEKKSKKKAKKKSKKKAKEQTDLEHKKQQVKKKKKKKNKLKLEIDKEKSGKKKAKKKSKKKKSNKATAGKKKKQKLELEPKDSYEVAEELPLSDSADMSFTEWLMHIRTAGGKFDIPYQDFSKEYLRVTTARPKKKKKKSDKVAKIAMKSVASDSEIISVELADLLALQGKHKKAIKMYEKLRLIFPEKNSFFAAKIDKLVK